jgi:hypothetical protein
LGKVLSRAHNGTTATAAETYCKEPAAIAHPPEKIVHAHTTGKGDESIINLAFHVSDCFVNTNMPRDPRVDLCGSISEKNTCFFDRMILALMVVAAGTAFDDYTMRRPADKFFEHHVGNEDIFCSLYGFIDWDIADIKVSAGKNWKRSTGE